MGQGGQTHVEKFKARGVLRKSTYQAPPEVFTIIREPGHHLYDPTSPLTPSEWLVQSIDRHGVICPVSIETDGNRLLVARGRDRVQCAVEANRRRAARNPPAPPRLVPYMLREQGSTDASEREAKDVENLHRRRVGAATRAEIAATYKQDGYDNERIAEICNIPVEDVDALLAVNDCAPELREAMELGRIDWKVALTLREFDRATQIAKMGELALALGVEVKRKRRLVKKVMADPNAPPKPRMLPPKKIERLRDAFVGSADAPAIMGGALIASVIDFILTNDPSKLNKLHPTIKGRILERLAQKPKKLKASEEADEGSAGEDRNDEEERAATGGDEDETASSSSS